MRELQGSSHLVHSAVSEVLTEVPILRECSGLKYLPAQEEFQSHTSSQKTVLAF